jgi:hypothetical protein
VEIVENVDSAADYIYSRNISGRGTLPQVMVYEHVEYRIVSD